MRSPGQPNCRAAPGCTQAPLKCVHLRHGALGNRQKALPLLGEADPACSLCRMGSPKRCSSKRI